MESGLEMRMFFTYANVHCWRRRTCKRAKVDVRATICCMGLSMLSFSRSVPTRSFSTRLLIMARTSEVTGTSFTRRGFRDDEKRAGGGGGKCGRPCK